VYAYINCHVIHLPWVKLIWEEGKILPIFSKAEYQVLLPYYISGQITLCIYPKSMYMMHTCYYLVVKLITTAEKINKYISYL
jgi:hypothetical protein